PAARRVERRRVGYRVDQLRRELREADLRCYGLIAAASPRAPVQRPAMWRAPAVLGAGLAAAITLVVVAQLTHEPPRTLAAPQSGINEPPTAVDLDALVPSLDAQHRPVFSPAFASNGTALFFHTGRAADSRSALMAMDITSPKLRVISILDDGARNYHVQP